MGKGIINAHCHIYPEKIAAKAVASICDFYGLNVNTSGTAAGLVKDCEKHGVTHYLVHSVATTPEQVSSINNFISREASSSRGKFIGFGTLHPDSDDPERDIEELISLGLRGVKLHPDFQGYSADGPKASRLGEVISGKGLPVLIHCGDTRYELSNPPQMKVFLDRFPEIPVIGAHFGGWQHWDEAMEYLAGRENFYVDTSSCLSFMTPEYAEKLIRSFGVENVLFGTDYPMWECGDELELFAKVRLTEQERGMILFDNAAKLLGVIS